MMRFTLLFCFSLCFASLHAQQVTEVQQTLIVKRTATWCSKCGSWGWDFFNFLIEDNSDKAVFMAAHFGGSELETATSQAVVDNFGGFGQPKFFLNGQEQPVSSSTLNTARQQAEAFVNDEFASDPIANTGLECSVDGNTLTVNANVKFFQTTSGDFYLGLYLVESGVIANQASQGPDAEHKFVLQDEFTSSSAFGFQVVQGDVDAGYESPSSYDANIAAYDLDQLEVVAVIWNKVDDDYEVVNVWSTPANGTTANVDRFEDSMAARLRPNLIGDTPVELLFDLPDSERVTIQVFDTAGQLVATLNPGQLPAGPQTLELAANLFPASGTYRVLIRAGQRYQLLDLVKL